MIKHISDYLHSYRLQLLVLIDQKDSNHKTLGTQAGDEIHCL